MLAVIQRVSEASVTIDGKVKASIDHGFLVLLGIAPTDTKEDVEWLSKKIAGMRIMGDREGKMNLSLKDTNGELLLISQFTLFANTLKGNRPSFIGAAKPEVAIPLYREFIKSLESDLGKAIQTGEFGAEMQVKLINEGPVTIIIDTKNKT
jgi:D-aminoacyl-tRNA deacylase